jgi:hypothetical protein
MEKNMKENGKRNGKKTTNVILPVIHIELPECFLAFIQVQVLPLEAAVREQSPAFSKIKAAMTEMKTDMTKLKAILGG